MGNSNGSISGSGFTTLPIAKYYDSYVKTNEEYVIKEQAILGDATWETIYWYADGADTNLVSDENSWIYRGGIATSNEDSGVYYFYRTPTMAAPGYTFRTVLMP